MSKQSFPTPPRPSPLFSKLMKADQPPQIIDDVDVLIDKINADDSLANVSIVGLFLLNEYFQK